MGKSGYWNFSAIKDSKPDAVLPPSQRMKEYELEQIKIIQLAHAGRDAQFGELSGVCGDLVKEGILLDMLEGCGSVWLSFVVDRDPDKRKCPLSFIPSRGKRAKPFDQVLEAARSLEKQEYLMIFQIRSCFPRDALFLMRNKGEALAIQIREKRATAAKILWSHRW